MRQEYSICEIRQERTSLLVQWVGICLPMQRIQVQCLVREGVTCYKAAKAHGPQLPSLNSRA